MALVQLIYIDYQFSRALDNNEFTIGIFIDLSKAFDTVDHGLLVKKMQLYGIAGIELQWYLNNCKPFFSWNDSESSYRKLYGVPQCSILGPLHFIIYVDDLYLVSKKMGFIIFADNTNIFMLNLTYEDLIIQINVELNKVNLWFQKINYPSISKKLLGVYIDEKSNWRKKNHLFVTKFLRTLVLSAG